MVPGPMKLGLGLYRHMLNQEHYAFAVQAGCTHIIAHLVDYFKGQVARSTTVKGIGERAGGPVNNCEELLMSLKTPSCAPCMTACTPVN